MQDILFIDSHSAGEPTRVVLAGGPDLGDGSLKQRLQVFQEHFDWFRSMCWWGHCSVNRLTQRVRLA